MDYIINFYKNGKYLLSVGANNADYDDVIWWQLHNIINYENLENLDEKAIDDIRDKFGYWYILDDKEPLEDATNIDIANKTMHLYHSLYFYDIDDEIDDVELIEEDGKYYADHGEDEPRDVLNFECDYFDLLTKLDLTFEEYEKVNDFINKLLDTNETDFIVNKTHFLTFQII